ncbi:molybdopterin converting factor subunit 1 [Pseudoteredinibacter isoporae]|uniref:Molybdopterin synthase sulfur carrier subunit n=1 Tax=Pseudoteredinibacter isoporae TaxID=570281 RepID=A0A7X0JVX6_9GAMM|nr:molybdopterin converting factor subunit 1 [Pseudoteredinibacter isoporae]MBB6522779.1 molybdopterin synthase sulfur carrier subunit [Pseudoteredinibacter isoporae]NHO88306.1 molybdopterin converting factor subunit 1 [Pseudoteredinibacter isoporae]NIB23363.1 molybdopterin converting factor subunit 1 [Pseudoteredinibacter isoporae]
MITLLYFARYREALGQEKEQLELDSPCSLQDLLNTLRDRGEPWASTLNDSKLLMAINQTIAPPNQLINDGDEVALFPPVTGG